MLLGLVAILAMTAETFAQSAGEVQGVLGSALYVNVKGRASGSSSSYVISPYAAGKYMYTDKIGIDGGLQIIKGKNVDLALYPQFGASYYYYGQDKMRVNGGVLLTVGLGSGAETTDDKGKKVSVPIDISIIPAQIEWWPMEGGAFFANVFYTMEGLNRGDAGSNSFGIGLGTKIRLK